MTYIYSLTCDANILNGYMWCLSLATFLHHAHEKFGSKLSELKKIGPCFEFALSSKYQDYDIYQDNTTMFL